MFSLTFCLSSLSVCLNTYILSVCPCILSIFFYENYRTYKNHIFVDGTKQICFPNCHLWTKVCVCVQCIGSVHWTLNIDATVKRTRSIVGSIEKYKTKQDKRRIQKTFCLFITYSSSNWKFLGMNKNKTLTHAHTHTQTKHVTRERVCGTSTFFKSDSIKSISYVPNEIARLSNKIKSQTLRFLFGVVEKWKPWENILKKTNKRIKCQFLSWTQKKNEK